MKIYAVCVRLDAGYLYDQDDMKKAGIQIGDKIELVDASVGGWHTDVYLKGYDTKFNSVFFDFEDEDGNPYNIYTDKRFATYIG